MAGHEGVSPVEVKGYAALNDGKALVATLTGFTQRMAT
jgi:hypothetical protein